MKVIGFFGYNEKVDLMTSLTKILNLMGKSVLVVDGTFAGKYKYVIPSLDTLDKSYVTQFDGVDYAVGFNSMNDVDSYMASQNINVSLYDYIIVDVDNPKTYEFFRSKSFEKMYYVFNTSMLALKMDTELVNTLKVYATGEEVVPVSKILYRGYMTRTSEKYFQEQFDAMQYNFDSKEYEIEETDQDRMLYFDFQISGIIQIRKHSKPFVESIVGIASEILDESDMGHIKKIIKRGGI